MIDLLETQYWSYEKLRDLQTERMRVILKHAYENVKAYRRLYKMYGIDIRKIKEIEDLKMLPIVTRTDLQQYSDWIYKPAIKTNMRTGGSTGEPMSYHEDEITRHMRAQKHHRGWLWSGFDQDIHRRAIICSSRGSVKSRYVLKIRGDIEKKDMKMILDQLKSFEPLQLRAYVSSAYIMAQWILKNNYEIIIPSINLIAEQLYPTIKEIIEKAFNGKVFEEYVCCDGGSSAWDCEEREGLHETMERAIIEHDENNNMIVTDLWNMAFPFIRYVNGDKIFKMESVCSCGRALPLIKIQGRDNDILTLPAGCLSPSFLLHHISHELTELKRPVDFKSYQLIQESETSIVMSLIKGKNFKTEDERTLMRIMSEICKGMNIEINYVDALEKSKSGKIKFIINRVIGND